jgi:hypothetical protein
VRHLPKASGQLMLKKQVTVAAQSGGRHVLQRWRRWRW